MGNKLMEFYETKVFPKLMEMQMSKECYSNEREVTLKGVQGKVLEIGFGTGLNIPHYPKHINNIVALDINPGVNVIANKRIKASSIAVDYHCLNGEKLPFETGSFDTVISTWTLCSIADLNSALLEVRRVLNSNGTFVFLEHGLSEDILVQKMQNMLTPLQKVIACGCHLNRDISASILQAGFDITGLERFKLIGATSRLAGSMYRGIATPIK